MAKNWSMKEATNEILAGNKEAIQDVGKRFPLTANAIARIGDNEGAKIIINALPEHFSVRKVEAVLKDGVADIEDDEIETPEDKPVVKKEEKKPAKKETAKAKKEESEDDDLESMSEVELFKLCKAKKIKAAPKQDKQYYIDLLSPKTEDADDDWDNEEVEEKPVKKAPAKKEAPKKEAKKAPAKKAAKEEDADEDDDDWDI